MVITATKLSKSVIGPDHQPIQILEDVDLNIREGEFLAVLGPSGSGKTTLLQILGLMDAPSTGELCLLGQDIKKLSSTQKANIRANNIGFVFQTPLLINELTLEENINLVNKISNKRVNDIYINELIDKVGLKGKNNHYPGMLSTGEAQRGALARAIINTPQIIFADEPTANLDKDNKRIVLELLKSFNLDDKITIVLASHDDLILQYTNNYLKLRDGKVFNA